MRTVVTWIALLVGAFFHFRGDFEMSTHFFVLAVLLVALEIASYLEAIAKRMGLKKKKGA